MSLAVYARGVNLYFIYGVGLPDPRHLLQGSGNQGRFVRLESAAMLDRPEIRALVDAAIAEGETPLPKTGRGYTVIKSVSPKQRLRRPAPANPTIDRAVTSGGASASSTSRLERPFVSPSGKTSATAPSHPSHAPR